MADAYVIITSREEVFKEFEKEKVSAKDIKEFENKLNLRKPSYDYEKRKEILLNWAEEENCKWFGNEKLKDFILDSIVDEQVLPTPLSIRAFAVATVSIENEDELREILKQKSKETAKSFAKEIKNMTDDKILFLSFLFIYNYFRIEFVKANYEQLRKGLDLEDSWEFDRIFNWFKGDKIVIIHGEYIRFSHPSYSEAFEHLIAEEGYTTRIGKEIFLKVLLQLSNKHDAATPVAEHVAKNFDKLPVNVRNELLLKLSENAAGVTAKTLKDNFDKLPANVTNELLLKLSEKDEAAWYMSLIVVHHFDVLPANVRNSLFKLFENEEAVEGIVRAVVNNFKALPEYARDLLFDLSDNNKSVSAVAKAVFFNFEILPENFRNKLLLKISEKEEAAWYVARVVKDYSNRLPEKVRNELLLRLPEKEKKELQLEGIFVLNQI